MMDTKPPKYKKIYQDEPIAAPAPSASNVLMQKYRYMRRLAAVDRLYYDPAATFYRQAKFMEDFEDDFDHTARFTHYYPTYQSMNDKQLRGYFSWRTKLRHGTLQQASLSFAYVYIYELINQIGVKSAEEGFRMLKDFWLAYRKYEPTLDHHTVKWLKDYVVFNNLDCTLLDDSIFDNATASIVANPTRGYYGHMEQTRVVNTQHISALLDSQNASTDDVFDAVATISDYKLAESRFFKQYPDDMKLAIHMVFNALSTLPDAGGQFIGKMYSQRYVMFNFAVFHQFKEIEQGFTYTINSTHKYIYKDNLWNCERFFCYSGKGQPIGDLMKTIDFMLRRKYNLKSSLKPGKSALTPEVLRIVEEQLYRLAEHKQRMVQPKINIDKAKLSDIRLAAQQTQEKLLVDELELVESIIAKPTPAPIADTQSFTLSEAEYSFMQSILYGSTYVPPKGTLVSVLVESINERAIDFFGDIVLENLSDQAVAVIEDYKDELRGIIHE